MLILLYPLTAYCSIYFTVNLQQFFRFQKVLQFCGHQLINLRILAHLLIEGNQGAVDPGKPISGSGICDILYLFPGNIEKLTKLNSPHPPPTFSSETKMIYGSIENLSLLKMSTKDRLNTNLFKRSDKNLNLYRQIYINRSNCTNSCSFPSESSTIFTSNSRNPFLL